jgi:hypothetical protein
MSDLIERRINCRNRFACFAHFRQLGIGSASTEWLCVTTDFSFDGIYFLADDHGFQERMQLLLRFPYSVHLQIKNREYFVEVTRVTRMSSLLQRRCGVGARLTVHRSTNRTIGLLLPESTLSENSLSNATLREIDQYA